MDPRYMDFGEVDSLALHPWNTMNCGVRVGPNLFRSVSVLGCGNSLVRGRVQFGSLLLKTNHINTSILVEVLS